MSIGRQRQRNGSNGSNGASKLRSYSEKLLFIVVGAVEGTAHERTL